MKILFIINLFIKNRLLNQSEGLLQRKGRLRTWNKPRQNYES